MLPCGISYVKIVLEVVVAEKAPTHIHVSFQVVLT